MKLIKLIYAFYAVALLCPFLTYAQAPVLGTTYTYSIFTSAGEFHNFGISTITGDIGTNVGILDGFPPGIVIGNIHVADPASAQAKIDLGVAYADLANRTCNNVIGVTMGNDQLLLPGVHCSGAASTLNGNLTFDGAGNPSSIFIIQINGAFASTTLSTVTLINGASACNIFWQINGAFALSDFTVFKGTVIANGALSLHTGVNLEGRALSVAGAVFTEDIDVCTRINPPSITCPTDNTVTCAANVPPANVNAIITTDICGGLPSVSVAADVITPGSCANKYTITRVYTAKDACGNSNTCTQTITVNDNIPPTISCPANITVSCPADIPVASVLSVTSTDNCNGSTAITVAPDILTGIIDANNYTVLRTYTSTDACGNTVSCTQTIVVDATAVFSITCPANLTVSCSSAIPPANIASVSTSGNCGGMITVTVAADVITPGSCINNYTITRTYTATEASGNSLSCSQTITVADNIAPLITCPPNITVSCLGNVPAPNVNSVITSDNCGGTVIVNVAPDVITAGTNGNSSISRTYSATDACGNTSSCTQIITVTGGSATTITCPPSLTVSCSGNVPTANVASVTTTGSCGSALTITVLPDVISNFSCANNYTITRTYVATDVTGNSINCSQIITVLDNIAPVITCPASVTVDCGFSVPTANINSVTTSDNCLNAVTVTVAPDAVTNSTCANKYTITRTYTATDQCGNSASCSQIITVNDNTAPVIEPLPLIANILCSDNLPVQLTASASDNCSALTLTASIDPYVINVCTGYAITYRWIAVDLCGNTSEMTRSFNVLPNNQSLVLSSPPQLEDISCNTAFPPHAIVTASAGCGGATVIPSVDPYTVNTCEGYMVTYRWTATDQCGNTGQVTRTFDVRPDTEAPAITSGLIQGSVVTVQCNNADNEWDPFDYSIEDITAIDGCSEVILSLETKLLEVGICGVSDFISRWNVKWTALDECGNKSDFNIEVKIVDLTPPVFNGLPEANVTASCESIPEATIISATDDCGNAEVTMTETVVDGPCEGTYTIIRNYKASTGDCDMSNYFVQTINVIDIIPPVITFNGFNQSNYVNGDSIDIDCAYMSAIQLGTSNVTIISECGTSDINFDLQYNHVSNCAQTGFIFVAVATWTAVDDCGNRSSFVLNFKVKDITPPVIKGVPDDICVATLPPVLNVQITDDCSSVALITSDANPVSCSDGSSYVIRTWTATDDCGNTAQASQTIVINHSGSGPDITNSIPIFQNTDINDIVYIEAVAGNLYGMPVIDESMINSNSCTGEVKLSTSTQLVETGDCLTDGFLYKLSVMITATDFCGYSSTVTYLVNIVDNTGPVFIADNNVTINCGDEIPKPDVLDNSNESAVITFEDQNAVANFCTGEVPLHRLWTATDNCGNKSSFLQKVHIIDTKGPQLSGVPEDDCNSNVKAPVVTAFDKCSASQVEVFFSENTEQSGCGAVIVRTWSATDDCGNTTSRSQRIFSKDIIPPVIKANQSEIFGKSSGDEIELECSKTKYTDMITVLGVDAVSATDNCEAEVKIDLKIKETGSGNCSTTGYVARYQYVWTATDKCGNSSEFVINVKFVDHEAPVFMDVPADLTLNCKDAFPPLSNVIAVDECFLESITSDQVKTYDDGKKVIYIRTWTAVDICGNQSQAHQQITQLNSTFNCVINLPEGDVECSSIGNIITTTLSEGSGPYIYNWDLVNCDGFILTGQGTDSITVVNGFTTMNLELTVTDGNGCISTCFTSLECYNNIFQNTNEKDLNGIANNNRLIHYPPGLVVYPNPANEKFTLQIEDFIDVPTKIEVIDMMGNIVKTVKTDNFSSAGIEVKINELKVGVYMINAIQYGQSPLVKKLVVLEF